MGITAHDPRIILIYSMIFFLNLLFNISSLASFFLI